MSDKNAEPTFQAESETAKDNLATTVKQFEDSFFTCPICYEIYLEPKCLPCLHTLCCHCLRSYIVSQKDFGIEAKKGFPCPICKQFVFIKSWANPIQEWANDIKKNFFLQNMIDSLVPKSECASSGIRQSSSRPTASAPDTLPSAPPLHDDFTPSVSAYSTFESDARLANQLREIGATPSDPPIQQARARSDYNWDALSSETASPAALPPHPSTLLQRMQSLSSSSVNLSGGATSIHPPDNLFRTRVNSVNDVTRGEPLVSFVKPQIPWEVEYRFKYPYTNPQFSDVCHLAVRYSVNLPIYHGIIATDLVNRKVMFFYDLFRGNNCLKSVKVKGRPSTVAVLDKQAEHCDCVIVNLENKSKLIFISVPEMKILREMKTKSNYCSVAVISPDLFLAGSSDRPATIDLIQIDQKLNYQMLRIVNVFKNGVIGDFSSPNYMSMLSSDTFIVSDSGKKGIVCFDFTCDSSRDKKSKKLYSIAPKADRKLHRPGGLCVDNSTGSVYTADRGSNTVLKIIPGDTIVCETLLTNSDGIYEPTSVCFNHLTNQLCVVDWNGNITVYKQCTK